MPLGNLEKINNKKMEIANIFNRTTGTLVEGFISDSNTIRGKHI